MNLRELNVIANGGKSSTVINKPCGNRLVEIDK